MHLATLLLQPAPQDVIHMQQINLIITITGFIILLVTTFGGFYYTQGKTQEKINILAEQLKEAHTRIDKQAMMITEHGNNTRIHIDPERDERRLVRIEEKLEELVKLLIAKFGE